MTRYREILRLHAMGLSQRNIAYSCNASKATVNLVIKRAKAGTTWPLNDGQTDGMPAEKLFPKTMEVRTMINNCTVDKLIEMRLTGMSDALRQQMADPKMKEISFEERFGMVVDIEYTRRKNNRLQRLIRNTEFDQPNASIMDIDYASGRRLNKYLIKRLVSCDYIPEYRKIFITGATGSGYELYWLCLWYGGMQAAF